MFKWWPTYEIQGLYLKWKFFCLFSTANYAFGLIKFEEIERPKLFDEDGEELGTLVGEVTFTTDEESVAKLMKASAEVGGDE